MADALRNVQRNVSEEKIEHFQKTFFRQCENMLVGVLRTDFYVCIEKS